MDTIANSGDGKVEKKEFIGSIYLCGYKEWFHYCLNVFDWLAVMECW